MIDTGEKQRQFEFRQEYIDLTHLNIEARVGDRLSEHRAWEQASSTVFRMISRLGEDGWEPVEPSIGFSLLVIGEEKASCLGVIWQVLGLVGAGLRAWEGQQAGSTSASSPDLPVLGARLHFRRIVKPFK